MQGLFSADQLKECYLGPARQSSCLRQPKPWQNMQAFSHFQHFKAPAAIVEQG